MQKPARYTGGELNSIIKNPEQVDVRFALCFPDTYEIGMSHLGSKILYSALNSLDYVWCERAYTPWVDFEAFMRSEEIALYGLESGDSVKKFDFIGFSLLYEMSYTNVLNMLDLAGLPVRAKDRPENAPIVLFGGPCTCNAEPVAPFADLICLGEGEDVLCELTELYRKFKREKRGKKAFLLEAAGIDGVYVPGFYDIAYNPDGTVAGIEPNSPGVPATVTKRVVTDLDRVHYPSKFVVPFIDIVHDRAITEVFRGCIRGCRFCQAGFIYRPVREKSPDVVNKQSSCLCSGTGYDEVSLSSLSTSDYSSLPELFGQLLEWTEKEKVSLALPSLRADNFSRSVMEKLKTVRKSGLTFAPEAGTQRLRDVINKNVSEEDILKTCRLAFEGGWTSVKLYFMMGLPTETMEDIEGIAALAQKVVDTYYSLTDRPKGKAVNVTISVAVFVPKPFTPFQWEPQDTPEVIREKQKHLRECVKSRKITVHCHESRTSYLEAVLARGDRRLADVIECAWEKGCRLDSWEEFFDSSKWDAAFAEFGLDETFYAGRKRGFDELFPWEHIFHGVDKQFLIRENQKAHKGIPSQNCRECCTGCGANKLKGGVYCAKLKD